MMFLFVVQIEFLEWRRWIKKERPFFQQKQQQQQKWFDAIFFSDILKFPLYVRAVYLIFFFVISFTTISRKKEKEGERPMNKKNDNDIGYDEDDGGGNDVFQVSWTRIWMKHTHKQQKGEHTKNFCEFYTLKTIEECVDAIEWK